MKRILFALLFSGCTYAAPQSTDNHYCIAESDKDKYSDVIICFNLDTHSHFAFGMDTWSISGAGWNRVGGFAPISGSIATGVDQNGIPSYFVSWTANLNQTAQIDPHGVAFYIVAGNYVVEQSKLGIITSSTDRFNPLGSVGVSYREDIMVNASLFGDHCSQPWLCWDIHDGKTPHSVWRLDENDLPFFPPTNGGH